ncbi:hypothetical protein AFCA_013295 [Aspergillus flavus]|nr:hypothetical protein AFCA_013295 [Aspergillus flavus]
MPCINSSASILNIADSSTLWHIIYIDRENPICDNQRSHSHRERQKRGRRQTQLLGDRFSVDLSSIVLQLSNTQVVRMRALKRQDGEEEEEHPRYRQWTSLRYTTARVKRRRNRTL